MSRAAFEQFLEKLKQESGLQQELGKLLARAPGEPSLTVSEFAALGARHGFAFTEADVAEVQGAGELGMEQLEGVAAGAAGTERQFYTVELVNASIAGLRSDLLGSLSSFKLRGS